MNPSFSKVLTWETMLSSNQSTVMGILAPHLSQTADIPHFTAIAPVLLELGDITPGLGTSIRGSSSIRVSDPNLLNCCEASTVDVLGPMESNLRPYMRPLDAADILDNQINRASLRSIPLIGLKGELQGREMMEKGL